ncbi:hypothetical protein DV515_00000300 [Chloebia gouldiae]|uniref:Uncharacterized protein n=1 Tax=Chloebia gouldiae TaxID=44316 RepID=A0A3L8T0R3_CHLGU|nr:hypothetical protein DV515_00000300 [Chloebia gouldiae]
MDNASDYGSEDSMHRGVGGSLGEDQGKEGEERKTEKNEPGRSRTYNLLIRSQTRYPLRHWPPAVTAPHEGGAVFFRRDLEHLF